MKKLTAFTLAAIILLSFCACSAPKDIGVVYAQITMEDGGVITLELDGDTAPITVDNFIKLANSGKYDGTIFHRVIKGFMIQGGDPTGTRYGDPSIKTIKGEFSANGVQNSISHKRGVISMARSNKNNSASSQFFICHEDSTQLDGQYAAFGHVIAGMDVVDRIAETPVNSLNGDRPYKTQKMASVKIIDKATADAAVAAETADSSATPNS